MKNFTDLTRYPVGTKVKNRQGEVGEISFVYEEDNELYPVLVDIHKTTGTVVHSFTKEGSYYQGTQGRYYQGSDNHSFDIVEVVVDDINMRRACKEGDILVFRNGNVAKIKANGSLTNMYGETFDIKMWRNNGRYYIIKESDLDIIQILSSE